jgi:cytochrome b6-f complex iron-sulfur subunit
MIFYSRILLLYNFNEVFFDHVNQASLNNAIMFKRRSFLTYFSIASIAGIFSAIITIFKPRRAVANIAEDDTSDLQSKDVSKAGQKKPEGFAVIGSVGDLDKNGYLQTKGVTLVRNPTNSQQLIAVNPKCTHQGCDVKWAAAEKKYACPCHSASFDANGAVLNGPATKPLTTYQAKIVGSQVLVKVSAPTAKSSQSSPSGRGGRKD